MKKLIGLLVIAFLVINACKKEDDELPIAGPSITVESDTDLTQGLCVGLPIQIKVEMKTSAEVGIQSFLIIKNGIETLVEETSIVPNNLSYTFNYAPTQADLTTGKVNFEFVLTDKDGMVATEILDLDVITDFSFLQEAAAPNPSWDLVENESLATMDGADVDIFLTVESVGCGFGCFRYRFTFSSKNGTQFYSLPYNTVVSPFNNSIKQSELLTEIAGISPVQELVVYSTFLEDVTSTGELNNLPVVAQLRGTDEYALIERINNSPGQFFYKKRSADAGK